MSKPKYLHHFASLCLSPKFILTINARRCCLLSKGKVVHEPWRPMAGANPGFCGMEQLGVLLHPPGWDASSSQGYPPAVCHWYPFIDLGGERQCGVKFLV